MIGENRGQYLEAEEGKRSYSETLNEFKIQKQAQ